MEAAGGGSILTMTYLGGERAVPRREGSTRLVRAVPGIGPGAEEHPRQPQRAASARHGEFRGRDRVVTVMARESALARESHI
jgi:hypothetical protein